MSGKGRLTNKMIDTFQTYYGHAIRSNKGNAEGMKTAIMAILYHYSSTTEEPRHQFCPAGPNSWCKWKNDQLLSEGEPTYRPLKMPISDALFNILKDVFEKLSDLNLLKGAEKCLTQNQNESLHHVIWTYLPKGEYHSPQEIKFGTALAVGHFNDGQEVFNTDLALARGLEVGDGSRISWKSQDTKRLYFAEYHASQRGKARRKEIKKLEVKQKDMLQYADTSYSKDSYYGDTRPPTAPPTAKSTTTRRCAKCKKPMKGHKRGVCDNNAE